MQVERLTTLIEILELVRDEIGAASLAQEAAAAVAPGSGAALQAKSPSRRKSLSAKAQADWPSLLVPLFSVFTALQVPANMGTPAVVWAPADVFSAAPPADYFSLSLVFWSGWLGVEHGSSRKPANAHSWPGRALGTSGRAGLPAASGAVTVDVAHP